MEISEFAFKLLLLFFPGIVCAYVVDNLTIHKPRKLPFFLLQSFVLGTGCYFLYWSLLTLFHWKFPRVELPPIVFLRALADSTIRFSFREIAYVSLMSVIVGCIISVLALYKVPNRIARRLGITKKFGELDVWGYALNIPEVVWITLRDHKNNLVYDGWIQAFSDDSKDAEVFLRDVSIYKNDTGEKLYQVGAVYISRKREDISIECRTLPLDERVRWKEPQNEGHQNEQQQAVTKPATDG
ncbi:MAG TPA: DUF6338 family protein [Verrucomicrobiae bacterium]|nr:DUF6338 family protein [Verrucomicrobiae bacterium]